MNLKDAEYIRAVEVFRFAQTQGQDEVQAMRRAFQLLVELRATRKPKAQRQNAWEQQERDG